MTSYSTSLRLWEGTPGDPAIKNAWGTALNTNDNLIEAAIIGTATVSVAGLTTYTLTTNNGSADQARPLLQNYTGAIAGDCTVTVPNVAKIGYAQNNTTGGHNIILTAGAGTTATIPPGGAWYLWSSDGSTNVALVSLGFSGGLSVSSITTTGAATIGGARVANSLSITTTGTITGNVNLGGTLGVTGSVTLSGSVSMAGSASVANTLTAPSIVSSGTISGTSMSLSSSGTIGGNLNVTGTVGVTGTMTMGAPITMGGTNKIINVATGSATGDVVTFDQFKPSVASPGYCYLPGGLLMQWGPCGPFNSETSATVTYPVAFPNNVFAAFATISIGSASTAYDQCLQVFSVGKSTMGVMAQQFGSNATYPVSGYWMAIGN